MAAEVEQLLSDYIAEHRAGGEADPLAYLERAEPGERAELAAYIDAYLARAPGREWDAAAYQGSAAERVADELGRSLLGRAGLWPAMLPRLRNRAQLARREVVERLAAALGFAGREDKVGTYYHEMEHGTLDSAGVSDRVLDALAEIYDTTAKALREIGEPVGEGPPPAEGRPAAAMARTTMRSVDYELADAGAPRAEPVAPAEERDEIDELFTGGP